MVINIVGVNRGKQFEQVVRRSFLKVSDVSVDRLPDQMTGFKVTSANICDFIVYKKPYEYYIECKSVHGASLPFTNITETQWGGLLEKSKIEGVFAGVICWWVDKDVTKFIPIQLLEHMRSDNKLKSINYQTSQCCPPCHGNVVTIVGKKKRVFFDYDMEEFFKSLERS